MDAPSLLPFPAFEEYADASDPRHPAHGSDVAVFLDRDGVVNLRRVLLVRKWSHFKFVPGVERALARIAALPVHVLVVTNQDAVGAGYIEETEMAHLHREMARAVKEVDGRIDAVYACVHARWQTCGCRKPLPGMLQAAKERYGLTPDKCWMVGDNAKDMRAGRAFGSRTILVDPRLRTKVESAASFADEVFANTPLALEWLATELERRHVKRA